MRLFSTLTQPLYLLLAVGSAIFMLALYPFVQILPQGINNYWFWFTLLTPVRWVLYIFYGILFGLTVSLFISQWKSKTCEIKEKASGGFFAAIGGFTGIILPQCAACISIAAIFLPTSTALFFTQHTTAIMAGSNLLLIGALYSMGGFKKVKK